MKVRKKPIEVEAIQWTIKSGFIESTEWLIDAVRTGKLHMNISSITDNQVYWLVSTLEGDMCIGDKDWLIRGIDGELYPCKDNIFRKTYDIVAE